MNDQLIIGDIRVSFLGKEIVRVERKYKGAFSDEATFFIPNRSKFGKGPAYSLNEGVLCFGDFALYLPSDGTLKGLRLEKNGKTVYTYKRLKNSGELPAPHKTGEVFALADNPRIFIPEGGYSVNRKGEYRVEENAEDIYLLFACGDAKKLRRLYVELTGRSELVRLATLGSWNSKYYAYSEAEAKQVILDYERLGVPLDNLVIDTDWRFSEKGWGYDINTSLFPDMKRFLSFAHSHGVEVMFNDHPEPVEGAHVFEAREISYRESNLQAIMALGMDTWWYDRNWQTHLISPTKQVQWESLGLYLYHDITKNFYSKQSGSGEIYRRPVMMGNVVEITNGDYLHISDSASHRYGIQWTGDIASEACTLAQEVKNLVRCSDNCLPYMNSDCGGHTGNPDKEQFIRWMQYGTLSPIFRPHCTKGLPRSREPWVYDGETLDIVRQYNLLRYRLMPCLYSQAYEAYQTGGGMFRSLALEYPNDKRAVRYDEYLLGKNLLIAPISGAVPQLLSAKNYTAPVEVTLFKGIEAAGKPILKTTWDQIYFNLHHEPLEEGLPVYHFSAKLSTKIKVDKPKRLYIKSDDGGTVYLDGKCVLEDNTTHSATLFPLTELTPNEEHSLEIKYFQGEGEAFLALYISDALEGDCKQVYLPEGKWMDVFDGKIYSGKRTITKRYALSCMPLFVRLGALLPLAYQAQTTREQSFERLVYDFYPDRESCDQGYLYEDDGETTAYRSGAFSKSGYCAKYSKKDNAFVVKFSAGQGTFEGARFITTRQVTLKYHTLQGADVARVSINGSEAAFTRVAKEKVFPLNTIPCAPDSETLVLDFKMERDQDYEIKFYLK